MALVLRLDKSNTITLTDKNTKHTLGTIAIAGSDPHQQIKIAFFFKDHIEIVRSDARSTEQRHHNGE